jgi:hypothetical protein
MRRARQACAVEVDREQAIGEVKHLLTGFDPTGIPTNPDRAAGPGARPWTAVGGFDFPRLFAKEINVVFNKQHVRVAQFLRFFTRPLPKP